MSDRDMLSLGIKITGFVWLLRLVDQLRMSIISLSFFNVEYGGEKLYSSAYAFRIFGDAAIVLLVSVLLLTLSDRISNIIIREEKALNMRTALSTAVVLIGIVFISLSIQSLWASIMSVLAVGENRTGLSIVWNVRGNWAYVVQNTALLLIGLYLTCFRQHIVSLADNWHKYFAVVSNFLSLKESDS